MKTYRIDSVRLEIVEGDILDLHVGASVNPANSNLQHGGGLAGQSVRRGGSVIQEESDRIGYCPVGAAVLTGAGSLHARWIIHTVGPRWGEGDEEKKLAAAVENSMMLAEETGVTSLALPAISTGIFGYPTVDAAPVILRTIRETASFLNRLRRIVLCLWYDDTYPVFLHAAEELYG